MPRASFSRSRYGSPLTSTTYLVTLIVISANTQVKMEDLGSLKVVLLIVMLINLAALRTVDLLSKPAH